MTKIVVTRKQLEQYGDTSLADVLRRVPGVTVTGNASRGVEIQMRGMSAAHLQLQVNGEPTGQGFALDSIDPALMERIEVQRTGTSDQSAQAVAGIVNIVLRRASGGAKRDGRITVGGENGRPRYLASVNVSDRLHSITFGAGFSASKTEREFGEVVDNEQGPVGQPPHTSWRIEEADTDRVRTFSATPSVVWKINEKQELRVEALLRTWSGQLTSVEQTRAFLGQPPEYPSSRTLLRSKKEDGRLKAIFSKEMKSGSSIQGTASLNGSAVSSTSRLVAADISSNPTLVRVVESTQDVREAAAKIKFSSPQGERLTISSGAEVESNRLDEVRHQSDHVIPSGVTTSLAEPSSSELSRLAAFVQQERQINSHLSTYWGLRWEGTHASTTGPDFNAIRTRSSVFSPIHQGVMKLGKEGGDQIRWSLSRTYKLPRTKDLIPRRHYSLNNSAVHPDRQGNPQLRPELSSGFDIAYEKYLSKKEFLSVGAFAKRIKHVVVRQVRFENGGWLDTPSNADDATVVGLEADGKFRLGSLPLELSGNMTRAWSRVHDSTLERGTPLESQTPLTINAAATYEVGQRLTIGTTLNHVAYRWVVRRPYSQVRPANRTVLDGFIAWRVEKRWGLRASIGNMAPLDEVETAVHNDGLTLERRTVETPSHPVFRVSLEVSL